MELLDIVEALLAAYGHQGWWPTPSLAGTPGYDDEGYALGPSSPIGPGGDERSAALRFEIASGAVLAQNTAWRGAARALGALSGAGALSPAGVVALDREALAALVVPAGTFRLKARYLAELAAAWPRLDVGAPDRVSLLALRGIGPETADCILLYAYGVPAFVADAYARRIMARLGLADEGSGYEAARALAEAALPRDAGYLAEAHALLVEHCKRRCRAKPRCGACPLESSCASSGRR